MANSCIFCKIIAREVPASVVSESDAWLSFNDINPQAPVHIVLISKKHAANLSELGPGAAPLVSGLIGEAERLTREKRLIQEGYRIVLNCNANGGQTVPHLHFHILAGRPMKWPPG